MSCSPAAAPVEGVTTPSDVRVTSELRLLFHRLNNQLGIVLAHAELLEARTGDPGTRSRAAQVVGSLLEAMGTARAIRQLSDPSISE